LKAPRSAVCLPLFFEERGRNGRAETAYGARWLVYSTGGTGACGVSSCC